MFRAYDKAFDPLEPAPFRGAAIYGCLCILAFNKIVGASWIGTFVGCSVIIVICAILPTKEPRSWVRRKMMGLISRAHDISPRWQLAYFLLVSAVAIGVQYWMGGFRPGRGLNFFLFPMLLSSLLFGLRIGLIAWPLCVLMVYYFVIPPRYSLSLASMSSFADLVIFAYECIVMAAIGVILYESSAASKISGSKTSTQTT